MATITETSISNDDAPLVTITTLDGTDDTFTLSNNGSLLILSNDTASPISPVISGDDATTVTISGVGEIDVSGGTDIFGEIAAGTEKVLKVNVVKDYLSGVISIASGTGLTARLLEF
ncbi:MAG: hypothetical protein KTR16_11585 [Acidiferrobacterales bacterium]|nr:hypothetical protein [Acidiferrobacterales bacterium]